MIKITIPFRILSSNNYIARNQKHESTFVSDNLPLHFTMCQNLSNEIEINKNPKASDPFNYMLIISTPCQKENINNLLEEIELEIVSHLNQKHILTVYSLEFDYFNYRIENLNNDININETFSIKIKETIDFKGLDFNFNNKCLLLRTLFNYGCKSTSDRDRFFNWYQIIEVIKSSEYYKKIQDNTQLKPLYSAEELNSIRNFAKTFDNEDKQFEFEKIINKRSFEQDIMLCAFFLALGIKQSSNEKDVSPIDIEICKRLRLARNALFHNKEQQEYKNLMINIHFISSQLINLTKSDFEEAVPKAIEIINKKSYA